MVRSRTTCPRGPHDSVRAPRRVVVRVRRIEQLRVELLGPVTVWAGDERGDIAARKVRSVVAMLALRPGHPGLKATPPRMTDGPNHDQGSREPSPRRRQPGCVASVADLFADADRERRSRVRLVGLGAFFATYPITTVP